MLKNTDAIHLSSEMNLNGFDMLFVFVNTPSLPDGSYEHTALDEVLNNIQTCGQVVVCSTVMPGYCRDRSYPILYNPQFVALGTVVKNQLNPDIVLIGHDRGNPLPLVDIYLKMCEKKPSFQVMSLLQAEIAKIALNCFITTKIATANSIGDICIRMGVDPTPVLHSIGEDSRIGTKCMSYGYGFGGPCFPRDNKALIQAASRVGLDLDINRAVIEANKKHLEFMKEQAVKGNLPTNIIRRGDKFVVCGVGYKTGSDVLECSQQLELAKALATGGKRVIVRDREEVLNQLRKLYGGLFIYENNV
jgi:nucleotide sugar dehydrogenase